MYSKYKPKKKDHGFLKLVLLLLIVSALFYSVYHYRDQLMFWKLDQSEIYKDIKSLSSMEDKVSRDNAIRLIRGKIESSKKENSLDPDVYILSSIFYEEVFKSKSDKTFSEMYVDEDFPRGGDYNELLYKIYKDIKKAMALKGRNEVDDDSLIRLARASYYSSYDRIDDIYKILEKIDFEKGVLNTEDVRFSSLVFVQYGEYDRGLEMLKNSGNVDKDITGKIFFAKILGDAKQYNESILRLREILGKSEKLGERARILLILGKLYYVQNLHKESAEQLEKVLSVDEGNTEASIWLGRNYEKMGFPDRAKEIWASAYEKNKGNKELNTLLER